MTTSALILIDIQNDYFPSFDGCKKPLPNMNEAAKNAATLLSAARENGTRVIHIRHIAASPDAPFFQPGTKGSKINEMVHPVETEDVLEKGRPNSFIGTGLETLLRENGIEHLTLCGAMSQMCVDATARAAVDFGFKVTIAHDACAASSVIHEGIEVSADMVHASIMAPLAASYAKVQRTSKCIN